MFTRLIFLIGALGLAGPVAAVDPAFDESIQHGGHMGTASIRAGDDASRSGSGRDDGKADARPGADSQPRDARSQADARYGRGGKGVETRSRL